MTSPQAIWLGVGGAARTGVADELRAALGASEEPWRAQIREQVSQLGVSDDLIASWKLWLDLRLALTTSAYTRCADAQPRSDDALRYGAGPSLLVSRDAELAAIQIGSLAFRFAFSTLRALELSVAEPARGPGGYQWILWLSDRDEHTQPDFGTIDLPIDYAPANTFDVLLATLHLASFLGARMRYTKVMDV